MDKVVYKIVTVQGKSLKSTNSRFRAAPKEICLTYSKKKKTVPLTGSLFVFENLKDAKIWKSILSPCDENIIIEGFARNVRAPMFRQVLGSYGFANFNEVKQFWETSKPTHSAWDVPSKTLICDSFTMRKVVG